MIAGLAYPFRALGLIRRSPEVWGLILIPILINIVVGALLYAGLLYAGLQWIDASTAGAPAWAAGLAWLLRGLLALALFVVIGFLLVRFGVVLGSPFYGQLSERLEQRLTGQAPPATPLSLGGIAIDLWRALAYELKKLALTLVILAPLLLIGLIPAVGQVAALAGQIALGALISCLDFMDSPLERRRMRFRAKLGVVRGALPASAGFGLVSLGLVSIPILNLLAIPLCVAGGTLFFCERVQPESTKL
jgi:CysZ protein